MFDLNIFIFIKCHCILLSLHLALFLVDTEYTELGGDEELPLGQEFQMHMACFVDTSKKKDTKAKYALAEKLVQQLE